MKENEVTMRRAIARLPRKQGLAVLLSLVEGEPYKDIASVLGCSVASAGSHVSKGKSRLRVLLELNDFS